MRQSVRRVDAHQAFEEIRGVIAAAAEGVLSREAYRELGVRQSILPRNSAIWCTTCLKNTAAGWRNHACLT